MRVLAIVAPLIGLLTAAPALAKGSDDSIVLPAIGVSGFVDASYSGNPDLHRDTFGLDQAEVDLTHAFGGKAELRVDLEWLKEGDAWSADVEQGYLEYAPARVPELTFTFGRFNAPIGFELLDPNEMYQYSHALVFDYGIPSNLTGIMAAGAPTDRVEVRAYLVNGWDNNDLGGAGPMTAGGRLGLSFGSLGGIGLSALSGTEWDRSGDEPVRLRRNVLDVDAGLTPVDGLLVGGEVNHGFGDIDDTDIAWTAFMIMSHYDFNAWVGLTGRFGWFHDPDGAVFEPGLDQTRTAVTVAPTFVLADGLGALVEVRRDGSTKDVFRNREGNPKGAMTTVAFEVTGSF
jgi:hypothetical protein